MNSYQTASFDCKSGDSLKCREISIIEMQRFRLLPLSVKYASTVYISVLWFFYLCFKLFPFHVVRNVQLMIYRGIVLVLFMPVTYDVPI